MTVDPSQLVVDAKVRFPGDPDVVALVNVKQGPFWDFVYRDQDGQLFAISLDESEVTEIELVGGPIAPRFTGDARRFRLGVEAQRIQNAFRLRRERGYACADRARPGCRCCWL